MASLASTYCRSLRRHFKVRHAAWPPGAPIDLGDFGPLKDGQVFVPVGNVRDLGMQFEAVQDPTTTNYEYKDTKKVQVTFTAKGAVAPGGRLRPGQVWTSPFPERSRRSSSRPTVRPHEFATRSRWAA
jgi:hypothetical protein